MNTRALAALLLTCVLCGHGALTQDRSPADRLPRARGGTIPTYSSGSDAAMKLASAQSLYKRKAEWSKLIDEYWGPGVAYAQKLAVFDAYTSYARANNPTFIYSKLNWDSVATYWRSKITDSTSRGAFHAILVNMSYALNDLHAYAADIGVISTTLTPETPYVPFPWDSHDVRYFGAALTPLPDSTLLVYKVVPNHPLGLQPGDRVLGYEGVPWLQLVDELVKGDVGMELLLGGAPSAGFYHLMAWAGMSWHIFDTIDVVKYGTGQTLHLPTLPLASLSSSGPFLQTEQLPVPGISMPSDNLMGSDVSWGIAAGTNVGYIYVYHEIDPKISVQFEEAVRSLAQTDGLIVDLRTNFGGTYGLEEGIARLVDFGDSTVACFRRNSATDLQSMAAAYPLRLDFRIPADAGTVYNHPVAVLIGPNCVSYGDVSAWQFTYVPNARFFGQSTLGAFAGRYWSQGPSVPGFLLLCPDILVADHRPPGTRLWAKEFPVDERVWFTPDDVANGDDTVVKRALTWINLTNGVTPGEPVLPSQFRLAQNYPNPFNPATVVSYQLPAISDVQLIVCDILGREVATLVNERKGPGRYEVTFDASNLASGVYLCRLAAGSYVQTRKMMVVK